MNTSHKHKHKLTSRLAKLEKLLGDNTSHVVLALVLLLAPAVSVAVEAGRVRAVPRTRVRLEGPVEDCR